MPLPNGVDPWGVIHPVCPSMMLMGNRGILHKAIGGPISKRWAHQGWVVCDPKYKADDPNWKKRGERHPDGKLQMMATLKDYSELFFLDEATSLAAGHRPCGMCRKESYDEFLRYWQKAPALRDLPIDTAAQLNAFIHKDRVDLTAPNKKRTFEASFDTLPKGAMFERAGSAYLVWNGKALSWSETGYLLQDDQPAPSEVLSVLTPKCIVEVLRAGYPVKVHSSADILVASAHIPSSHDEAEVIHKLVWKGDPVTWQRAVRDEWPDLREQE